MAFGQGITTKGLVNPGAGGSGVTPTIATVTPTPGVEPGAPGGFPGEWLAAQATPVVVDVTATGGLALIVVTDGNGETVFRDENFVGDYVASSYTEAIPDGVRLHILKPWDAAPDPTANSYVNLTIDAVNFTGDIAEATFV